MTFPLDEVTLKVYQPPKTLQVCYHLQRVITTFLVSLRSRDYEDHYLPILDMLSHESFKMSFYNTS